MKIAIQTWGSEGDIRPFVALANGLADHGHQVTLAYTSIEGKDYSRYLELYGVTQRQVGHLFFDEEALKKGAASILAAPSPIQQLKIILDLSFFPIIDHLYDTAKELCEEYDLVVGHFILYPLATAAERTETPYVVIYPVPDIPTGSEPPIGMPNLGKWGNRLGWWLRDMGMKWLMGKSINQLRHRADLGVLPGIAHLRRQPVLSLAAVSSVLVPQPSDWLPNQRVSGFLELATTETMKKLPDSLQQFLDAGTVPVMMTFGSMTNLAPDWRTVTQLMNDAVQQAGCRAIIQSRWDDWGDEPLPEGIYPLGYFPHHLILPHCIGMIHHGGAGTTQAAVNAGIPSIVVPHIVDQFFWGRRLYHLGVALKPLPRRRLTQQRLSAALLQLLSNTDMGVRARKLGERMRRESGVEQAVQWIESVL